MLLEEFLKPLGMTQVELAERIRASPTIIPALLCARPA